MKLSDSQRQATIQFLTTNSEAWKGEGELLSTFTDDKLLTLKSMDERQRKAIDVANRAANGYQLEDGTAVRINPETGEWQTGTVENKGNSTQTGDEGDEDGGEEVETRTNKVGKKAKATAKNRKGKTVANRSKDDEGDDEEDEGEEEAQVRTPRTREEWLRHAPADIRNEFASARAIVDREKDQIINKLLSRVPDADRAAHHERLQRRTLDELNLDLSLLPAQASQEEIDQLAANAAAGNKGRQDRGQQRTKISQDEDVLTCPTINWHEKDGSSTKEVAANGNQSNSGSVDYGFEDMDEQEIIAHLPSKLRDSVRNAVAIENREKNKIIDELVSNAGLIDELEERKLRGRMEKKSLVELKDILMVSNKRTDQRPVNYFGAGSPPIGKTRRGQTPIVNDQDDVLTLPTMDWKENARLAN